MCKGLKAREGYSFSLTSPSHFQSLTLTQPSTTTKDFSSIAFCFLIMWLLAGFSWCFFCVIHDSCFLSLHFSEMVCKGTKIICCLQIIRQKSDDLTFHFRSLSFISFYLHLSSFIYKLSKVSDAFQKREGDGRENECPSRAFSPLYIGL